MSANVRLVCDACRKRAPYLLSCGHTLTPQRRPKFDPESARDGEEWREGLKAVRA